MADALKPNIGLVTFPQCKSGTVPVSHLIQILQREASKVYFISGGEVYSISERYPEVESTRVKFKLYKSNVVRSISYFVTQMVIAFHMLKMSSKVDIWIFFIGGPDMIFPMMAAKLSRRKVCISFAGSSVMTARAKKGLFTGLESSLLRVLQASTCTMADRLTVYTERLIKEWGLQKWEGKTSIAHEHFLALDEFCIKEPMEKRKDFIGYVGRLSDEKGVWNLVHAIPHVIKKKDDARFVVIGDGYLKDDIVDFLVKEKIEDKITMMGRVRHRFLPDYYNQFKLLVIPSSTEGLPNVLLESMSCGTPVLAASVGSIPDLVKDEFNGFLISDCSAEGLANHILAALEHPRLGEISMNGRTSVESEFTYQKAAERYSDVFDHLVSPIASKPTHGEDTSHI